VPIRELFHVMHIVDDFDRAQAFYDRLFDPEVFVPKHWSDFDKRWASIGVIGANFVLEIMEPSRAPEDQQAPLPKFRNRHGQHLHSMAWFVDVDDMMPLIERLRAYGVRVIIPYPMEEGAIPATIFTHPKDTFGQLEIQTRAEAAMHDPHLAADFSARRWLEGPLQLERCSHITTVVTDLDRAQDFYERCLGAKAFHARSTREVDSVFVLVGTETVVELARPNTEDSALARDLAQHGELPHSLTFKVRDLRAAARHCETLGVGTRRDGPATFTIEPADAFGAVISFTEEELPSDPRI